MSPGLRVQTGQQLSHELRLVAWTWRYERVKPLILAYSDHPT